MLRNTFVYPSVKGTTECLNLLTIDSFCRMEREVDCQQTRPVIHRLLNKTPDFPGSEIKASVICTILSLFNLVKPVKTHQQKHASIQTAVTGDTKEMTNQSG